MGFRKGFHYEHPPRGRARKPYTVSDAARRQRLANLKGTRLRSDWETQIIKLLIWQACFDGGPSQRASARQLGVWPSYVHKVQGAAHSEGMDTLVRHGKRVTPGDLADARRFTAKLREEEPGLLASAPTRRLHGGDSRVSDASRYVTAEEGIAETWREVAEWKRKNPSCYGSGRRVLFSVPVPH